MAQKQYNFTRTEIMAGLLVLTSMLVLVGFVALVRGWRPEEVRTEYYTNFSNTIGLDVGADVRFGGLKVGRVTQIAPYPVDQTQVYVALAVHPDTPVNVESVATVEQLSLTAPKHLEISTGAKDAARLAPEKMIRSLTKQGGLVELPDVTGITKRVEDLLDDARLFLGVKEAQAHIEQGGEDFARLTQVATQVKSTLEEGKRLVAEAHAVLTEQRPNIEQIMTRITDMQDAARALVTDVHAVLEENREPLHNTLTGVEKVAGDVGTAVDGVTTELDQLLDAVSQVLENAKGMSVDAQQFVAQNRPTLEDLVLDLRETVRYLKRFSQTLAEQPNAVLTGRKPEGRRR